MPHARDYNKKQLGRKSEIIYQERKIQYPKIRVLYELIKKGRKTGIS